MKATVVAPCKGACVEILVEPPPPPRAASHHARVRELKSAHPRGRLPMFNVVLLTGYVSCKTLPYHQGRAYRSHPSRGAGVAMVHPCVCSTKSRAAPLMGCVS